jgi:hypothetical protein
MIVLGCTGEERKPEKVSSQARATSSASDKTGHGMDADSDGWWCKEHGVPEKLCSLCMSEDEVKKQFKEKGDWCEKHDRAKSQCFKCDPKRYDYFSSLYREKFGKEPSRPPESEFEP